MQTGGEIAVEIEQGKTLIVRYLATGEPHEDGTRTVFFELNGQPREVSVAEHGRESVRRKQPMAEAGNANQIGAPMPGKISSVAVKKGQTVKAGERLLSIEAMKMETAIYTPRKGVVAEVLVQPGSTVKIRDLLVVLQD